jgi:hypothetical protein
MKYKNVQIFKILVRLQHKETGRDVLLLNEITWIQTDSLAVNNILFSNTLAY